MQQFLNEKAGTTNAGIYGKASHLPEHSEDKVLVLPELGSKVYAQRVYNIILFIRWSSIFVRGLPETLFDFIRENQGSQHTPLLNICQKVSKAYEQRKKLS